MKTRLKDGPTCRSLVNEAATTGWHPDNVGDLT
jgi:hypothetical protein